MLKKVAEQLAYVTSIAFCSAALIGLGYVMSQHVTCVDFIRKLCVVH